MSTTTSIFNFDHGQKKLGKAIGVTEEFLDDLNTQVADTLKDYLFDEDRNMRDDLSPSMLVEQALHNFSYNQLVVMSGFFLQHKLEDFTEKMAKKLKGAVKRLALDSDDIFDDIKKMLIDLAKESDGRGINPDDLPQEVKDFLDSLGEEPNDD
jgi:hypothetical protein